MVLCIIGFEDYTSTYSMENMFDTLKLDYDASEERFAQCSSFRKLEGHVKKGNNEKSPGIRIDVISGIKSPLIG
ncbi:hypothetical protein vseg_007686 [Gypsophila vaccaria]